MLKAKDKEARRGNLITFAIVLALTLVTMVLENVMSPGSLLFTVIKKGAVYSLVAVSMNLLNGFTGLFSLGQAGFMLLGAYAYAIFMIPDAARDGVYYLFEGSSIHFSFQEMFQHLFGATGFGGGGATREDVALFKAHVAPHVKIKAAGGIANLQDAEDFVKLGADRLGTSRIVKAVKALEQK